MRTSDGAMGIVKRVVRAAGQIYALGDYRRICLRIGKDRWAGLGTEGKGVPLPGESGSIDVDTLGFSEMSAFTPDDMYAVGGDGDVWRFNGVTWRDCGKDCGPWTARGDAWCGCRMSNRMRRMRPIAVASMSVPTGGFC